MSWIETSTYIVIIVSSFAFTEVCYIIFFHFQVLESYERAYSNMVRVQQLSELEEVKL